MRTVCCVALLGLLVHSLGLPARALDKVPAQDIVPRFSGDKLDLEVFPKPKKESYTGQAIQIGAVTLQLGQGADTAAAREAKELFKDTNAGAALTLVFAKAPQDKEAAWKPAPEQGYRLTIGAAGENVRVEVQARKAAGLFNAIQTLKQLIHIKDGKRYVREGIVEDWPSVKYRGVKGDGYIETFAPFKLNFGWKYIGLWGGMGEKQLSEIAKLAKQIEKLGGKAKGDDIGLDDLENKSGADGIADKQIKKLRGRIAKIKADHEKGVAKRLAQVQNTVKAYRDRHGEIAVSLNPGGTLNPTDAFLARVKETYKVYYDAGVRRFVMSFDDQGAKLPAEAQQRFASYAEAQAHVLREVDAYVRHLDPANHFYLCHQGYTTGYAKSHAKLVEAVVKAGLPERMEMCWTGTAVSTQHLTLDAVSDYAKIFGRPATFFYHNWPITAPKTECRTGPMPAHDPKLGTQVDILMMCSNHDSASSVAFLSGLDWGWNSEGYDPERSNKVAARVWASLHGGPPAYAPLVAVMEWNRTHSSRMIVRDQAQRTAEELTKLVDDEEALFQKNVPLLKAHLTDKKLVEEIEAKATQRIKLFRGIVEAHKKRRKGVAVRLAGAINLDGKLDEPAWQTAPALTDFTYMRGEKRAAPNTTCRILYDADFLYVGVRCEEPKIDEIKPYTKKTGWKIQHGDYIQLVFDETGSFQERGMACTTIYGQASMFSFGRKWMKGFEVKVNKGQDHWIAEFKLPLAAVPPEQKPAPGRLWGFNLIRRRVVKSDGSDWSSWSPLATSKDKFSGSYCGRLTFK